MSDFADRPFVMGTLTGLRAFSVDSLGRLRAPQQDTIWRPGENVAECRRGFARRGISIGGHSFSVPSTATASANLSAGHRPGSVSCGCGFYAYTDGKNDYYSRSNDTIQAVVEGYGLATVGSRGFRCEKARLVALVQPRRYLLKHSWVQWRLAALCAVAFFAALILGITVTPVCFIGMALPIVGFFVAVTEAKDYARPYVPDLTKTLDLYPDVPTYRSLAAALKAHPLTVTPDPERPTPDNRDDFWTNEYLSGAA